MFTILPSARGGFTTRTVEETIRLIPQGRADVWAFYDSLPMPLLQWMRTQRTALPSHTEYGEEIAYYTAQMYIDQPHLYVYEPARQDFAVVQMYGDTFCASCANNLIDDHNPDPALGLVWAPAEHGAHCDHCHIALEDQ